MGIVITYLKEGTLGQEVSGSVQHKTTVGEAWGVLYRGNVQVVL